MSISMRGSLLLLLAASSAPGLGAPAAPAVPPPVIVAAPPPQAPSVAIADTPAHRAAALKLAQLYMPADVISEVEGIKFDEIFAPQLSKNAEVAALEAAAPGAIEAVRKALRPLIVEGQFQTVTRGHAAFAALFARRLSDEDIAQLNSFYETPIARSLLRKIALGVDLTQTTEKVMADPNYKFGAEDLEHNVDTGSANGSKNFTADEHIALIKFSVTPAYKHLDALKPEISALVIEHRNKPDPEWDKKIETAMAEALERHVAAIKNKK